jgi:hypothetical protein
MKLTIKFQTDGPELPAIDASIRSLCWRLRLKCDGIRVETRFHLSAKRTSPFKSVGTSVQSITGRRAVRTSLKELHCSCKPVFCSHVTLTGYQPHSLFSPSFLLPCDTVCHHISKAVYQKCSATIHHSTRRHSIEDFVFYASFNEVCCGIKEKESLVGQADICIELQQGVSNCMFRELTIRKQIEHRMIVIN